MVDSVSKFGETAKNLARNPLGIIALFIVLIYGFASLVTAFSGPFSQTERSPLIYFLVLFPTLVLGVFAWLVSEHHEKLYGPGDYKDESNFVEMAKPELSDLKFASPSEAVDAQAEEEAEPQESEAAARRFDYQSTDLPPNTVREWTNYRRQIYRRARDMVLVHALQPSTKRNQKFDVFIYLRRRNRNDYDDIKTAEFFFGRHWGNKIFTGERSGEYIGVRTSAYGPFLCLCKVTFTDGEVAMLYRYIDFEMGEAVVALQR